MQSVWEIVMEICAQKIPGGMEAIKKISPEEYEQMKVDSFNTQEGKPVRTVDGEVPLTFSCYDCPICKNKETVAFLKDGYYAERPCECISIRKARIRAIHSGMESYLDKRLNNYEAKETWQKEARDMAKAFILDRENNRRWIAILGQSGAGKTHLCAAICNQLMAEGMEVMYFAWLTDGRRLIANRFDNGAYSTELERFRKSQVVYIDDLLKTEDGTKVTPTELKTARELLDQRAGKITIVSSEFLADELAKIDESLAGRLIEYSGKYLYQIKKDISRNYRLKMIGKEN